MTEEEMKNLKQTVDYFGHWYDVIGEERVAILEKAVNELEATKELEEENAELKEQIEKMKSDVKEMAEQADKNGDMLALKRMSELFEKWECE